MRTVCSITLLAVLMTSAPSAVLGQAYIKTELSKKTTQIKPGMSREEVVALLGLPMWAILPSDSGELTLSNYSDTKLELRWDNGPNCLPVTVQFDGEHEVVAVGKGRTCHREGIDKNLLPPDPYGCWHKDRAEVCR
jgi:hypothetical protein